MLVLVILENWGGNSTLYTTYVNFYKKIIASHFGKCRIRLDWKIWQDTAAFTFSFIYHKEGNNMILKKQVTE